MKKIALILTLLATAFLNESCRDESLNPVPVWESGLHAYTVFDNVAFNGNALSRPQPYEKNYAKNFPANKQDQAAAAIPFKIRWVSLDNKLTVAKIDIYVRMFESYTDKDGNPKVADLSGGTPKLLTTVSAPAANRQWNNFTVSPTQIYNLFKDASVKYDGTNDVKVFANPKHERLTGAWLDGKTDEFEITWKLTSTEGLVYQSWGPNLCGDPTAVSEANSNCNLRFTVNGCEYAADQFTGSWSVAEDGWADYKVGDKITVSASGNDITLGIFATDVDHKDIVLNVTDKLTGAVTVKKQPYGGYTSYTAGGIFSAEGSGTVNGCSGNITLTLAHTGAEGNYGTHKIVLKR